MSVKNFKFDKKKLSIARKHFTNRWLFNRKMFFQVPLNLIAGIRIKQLNEESCEVTVRYNWITKNPFKSIFWAVLGMAAEMSCGALVLMYTHRLIPSVSVLVGNCTGEFVRKGTDLTTFVCKDGNRVAGTIKKAIEAGEPQEVLCRATGYSKSGEEVAHFTFNWKIKARN